MAVLFADLPEARVHRRDAGDAPTPANPQVDPAALTVGGDNAAGGENDEAEELRRQAENGSRRLQKYGLAPGTTEDYAAALEIDVITRMKYPAIPDRVRLHQMGEEPRHSGGAGLRFRRGPLVAYAPTITDPDRSASPVVRALLNPERSMRTRHRFLSDRCGG